MLNDFSWNMTGYIPKHQVNPHGDGIIPYVAERIFQLEPEPPAVDSLNEYILSALREKNLLYFSFFLHHYETQLNKRIKGFLSVDGGNLYDTDRFIDIKISCREQMLQKLMDYYPLSCDCFPGSCQHHRGCSVPDESAENRAQIPDPDPPGSYLRNPLPVCWKANYLVYGTSCIGCGCQQSVWSQGVIYRDTLVPNPWDSV